jgi:hypothetical protein
VRNVSHVSASRCLCAVYLLSAVQTLFLSLSVHTDKHVNIELLRKCSNWSPGIEDTFCYVVYICYEVTMLSQ